MDTIRAFFSPKLGHFFPIFEEEQERPPPLPPLVTRLTSKQHFSCVAAWGWGTKFCNHEKLYPFTRKFQIHVLAGFVKALFLQEPGNFGCASVFLWFFQILGSFALILFLRQL